MNMIITIELQLQDYNLTKFMISNSNLTTDEHFKHVMDTLKMLAAKKMTTMKPDLEYEHFKTVQKYSLNSNSQTSFVNISQNLNEGNIPTSFVRQRG